MSKRIAINGFGRIGRAAFKIAWEDPDLEVVAVNDLYSAEDLAYLLRFDSVYGRFRHSVSARDHELRIGDRSVAVLHEKEPGKLPWRDLKVDVALECTGVFTKGEEVKKHIGAGAKRALLSAPDKGEEPLPITVFGASDNAGRHEAVSCASCTTNCITPVMEILDRRVGVDKATMTTIHAYTSSQALIDAPAKKKRRGRAAALSFIPASTGAARATGRALPEMKGRFDGVAVRGPVAVGSIADIVIVTRRSVEVDEVNRIFREEAASERYRGVLGVSEEEMVSADIVGDARASVVDLTMTQVVAGNLLKVMSWYDNEWGYAAQLIREAKAG